MYKKICRNIFLRKKLCETDFGVKREKSGRETSFTPVKRVKRKTYCGTL